jgi:thiopeptide-type bacteriocin biosynthesis protein
MGETPSRSSIAPSGFFVLRAPLLPFDELVDWPADPAAARARLRDAVATPEVREAIFIASRDLDARLKVWLASPDSEQGRKIERALLRYFIRSCARPTPFGMFAGCSVGGIGSSTRLAVAPNCRRHTRLDMDYLFALADSLSRDPQVQPHLRFSPNSSLYRVAGRARYLAVRRKDEAWSHHRAALAVPDYLEAVLARAGGGGAGATPAELVRALLDHDPQATHAEAAEYLAELIDQQVLVSELTPAVSGRESLVWLIDRLGELPLGTATTRLEHVREALCSLDSAGPGASPDQYRAIAGRLESVSAKLAESRLFRVDLLRPSAGATLGENVIAEITRGVELLRRLMPNPSEDALAAFREAFSARFGDTPVTREIPLAEALDDESGISFGEGGSTIEASSLLEDLTTSPPAPRRLTWGPRQQYLLARMSGVLARGEGELVLSDEDIERLAVPDPLPLPDAFSAMARIGAVSDEAVARGDFQLFLAGASGPSGARPFGRFCHADPDLAAAVAGHLAAEEALSPGAVFAEIVHLPEGPLGNLVARPTLRAYEIPYLGRSVAPAERQLPLSDLRVSLQGQRIVLRSEKLGREVLPRLTTAHNFANSHGIYAFLCALQQQGVAGDLGWDWGPLASSAFLPRIVRGRLVLSRARWRLSTAEVAALIDHEQHGRLDAIQHWRRERRLPRWICLSDFDNELPIDLDNPLMVQVMLSELKGANEATIIEMFPQPDQLCARGPTGRYVHEIIVPFVTQRKQFVDAGPDPLSSIRAIETLVLRVFPPGSEWLSVKLYMGPITADHLLRDVIGPLAADLHAEGLARRWFFVRYADPHFHVRLRFHGDPERLNTQVLPRLQRATAPLLADGRIWKVQLDTYEREIERYGGPDGIELCEDLFHHDSDGAVELLRLLDNDNRGDGRWRMAVLGMDRMLDDLGLDLHGKRALLRRTREHTCAELPVRGEAARQMNAKYRAESPALARLISAGPDGTEWSDARVVLERRTQRNGSAAALLRKRARVGSLTSSVAEIASSLLHMHVNRLLRSAHRMQEIVLYDFLHRYYEGQAARPPVQSIPARDDAIKVGQ